MAFEKGWLTTVAHCPSDNFNHRDVRQDGQHKDDAEVSLLVIHNISLPAGKFGGGDIEKLFCNQSCCWLKNSKGKM